ncbi:MAG TPA: hypothetical protein VE965_01205, partial [Gammaproteobacteria bacterium]|nr:hypothetical protein [Gammaproteobacteria bacterium]
WFACTPLQQLDASPCYLDQLVGVVLCDSHVSVPPLVLPTSGWGLQAQRHPLGLAGVSRVRGVQPS